MYRIFLFNRVWPHTRGDTMTCHQIWHYKWQNGEKRPTPRAGRDIQLRATGKPQRARRSAGPTCSAGTATRSSDEDDHSADDSNPERGGGGENSEKDKDGTEEKKDAEQGAASADSGGEHESDADGELEDASLSIVESMVI
jgi:hypothetical protein